LERSLCIIQNLTHIELRTVGFAITLLHAVLNAAHNSLIHSYSYVLIDVYLVFHQINVASISLDWNC